MAWSRSADCIKSVAIVNPLANGIGIYAWELANGLTANGVSVDVFGSGSVAVELPPSRHGFYPVLGSVLFKQRDVLRGKARPSTAVPPPASPASAPAARTPSRRRSVLFREARKIFMRLELALYLRFKGYDLIWTQWPDMEAYGAGFWRLCKALGMRVVHTVHNVLPHEESPGDRDMCERVYRHSDLLLVHSLYASQELQRLFPEIGGKIVLTRLGAYTVHPRRPASRSRVRRELGIGDEQMALLFCGAIRPYKNLDSVIAALADERCRGAVLVVAGREQGYSGLSPQDPLARTRDLVAKAGISERVRFLPRFLSMDEMSDLLEAGDVMMLPYVKSYGSAQLLLGMTFGKYILATATGGMDEYLRLYPSSKLLESGDPHHIIEGIVEAKQHFLGNSNEPGKLPPELQWSNIARTLLERMREAFCR